MASQFDDDSMAGATLLKRLQTTPYQPPQPQPIEPDQARRQRIAAILKQR